MKTAKERHEAQRKTKLGLIDKQLKSGSLVIRKMTNAERAQFPPRAAKTKRA